MPPPPAAPRPVWQALYPFRPHHATLSDGLRMHYLDEGRGEPVVMLHGNPTWSFFFRHLVTGLRATHRVIVPDHIGCGLSARPSARRYEYTLIRRVTDLEQLLEQLVPQTPVTLVMHDWGGMIGTLAALRRPERVRRLVAMNTAAFPPPGGKPLPWRLRLIRDTGRLGEALVRGLNAFCLGAAFMAPRRPLRRPVRQGLLAPYGSWRDRLAVYRFVRDIPLGPGDPAWEWVRWSGANLQRLAAHPLLLCWGARDFVFDRDYLNEWRRRFPAAEVALFERAGHYLLEDQPREVLTRVQRFLQADHRPTGTTAAPGSFHPGAGRGAGSAATAHWKRS